MAITQNHIINIQPGVSAPLVIHCSQGDTGTVINLTVVNGDEEFDCSSYACSVHGTRSDRANWGPFTCNVSGSTVSFSLTSGMTAVAGSCLAEVSIGTVGTANFALLVENATFENGVTYANDVSVYQNILAAVQTGISNETAERVAAVATEKNERVEAVNAEATARQNADATLQNNIETLQGNINSEAATRASADSNLQSRINQIVAPSGQAPSAAEVADGRIVDSATYNLIGDAIRAVSTNSRNGISGINTELMGLMQSVSKEISGSWNSVTVLSGLNLKGSHKYLIKVNLDAVSEQSGYLKLYTSEGTQIAGSDTFLNKKTYEMAFFADQDYADAYITMGFSSGTHRGIYEIYEVSDGLITQCETGVGVSRIPSRLLRNGTIVNFGNANYVTTPVIFTSAKKIRVDTNRPNTSGKKYTYSFSTSTEYLNDLFQHESARQNSIEQDDANYTLYKTNPKGVQISIAEKDINSGTISPLRINDFDGYEIFIYAEEKVTDTTLKSITRNLSVQTIHSNLLRNGSVLNLGNPNGVSTPMVRTKARKIEVVTDRPNLEGYKYWYQYVTSTGDVDDIFGTGYNSKYNERAENTFELNNDICCGVQIALFEKKISDGTLSPLRVSDFAGYHIDVFDISGTPDKIENVPSYYNEYMSERLETIREKDLLIGNHGDSFIFITDLHENNSYYSPYLAKHILDNTAVNRLVYGGDFINQPSSKALATSLLYTNILKCRVIDDAIFLRGNHETNPYGTGQLTEAEAYRILNGHSEKYIDTNGKCYFFKDNVSQKIRYIFLDTGENGDIDQTQVAWLQSVVQNTSSEYTIIVISHMAIHAYGKDEREAIEEYDVVGQAMPILTNADAKVACWVCGHDHKDMALTNYSFPIISVTCDANGNQASIGTSDNRDVDTINEQAFDVFHINTDSKTIYATRIGGGQYNVVVTGDLTDNDRQWTYT